MSWWYCKYVTNKGYIEQRGNKMSKEEKLYKTIFGGSDLENWWVDALRIMAEDYGITFTNPQYVALKMPFHKEGGIYNFFGVLDGDFLYVVRESETVPESAYHVHAKVCMEDQVIFG